MQVAQTHFRASLLDNPSAREYLLQRKIAAETIESFGLGYARPGIDCLDRCERRQYPKPTL